MTKIKNELLSKEEKQILKQISKNLIYIRNSKNLSQQKFAELYNIPRLKYRRWEYCENVISIFDLAYLCKKLNISIDNMIYKDLEKEKKI